MSTLEAMGFGVLIALFLSACGVTFDDVIGLPERLWRKLTRKRVRTTRGDRS